MAGEKFIHMQYNYKFPKPFLELMQKGNRVIEPQVIHDIVANALSDGWELVRSNANSFRKSGFLMDHIFVYMDTNSSGSIVSEADYSAAIEHGHRNRAGKMVGPRPFMAPAFNVVKTRLKTDMDNLVKSIAKGIRPTIGKASAPIKTGSPSVAHKPTQPSRTYAKQKTVTSRGRYYFHPSVATVKFTTPLTRSMKRTFRAQRIGGQG